MTLAKVWAYLSWPPLYFKIVFWIFATVVLCFILRRIRKDEGFGWDGFLLSTLFAFILMHAAWGSVGLAFLISSIIVLGNEGLKSLGTWLNRFGGYEDSKSEAISAEKVSTTASKDAAESRESQVENSK